MTYIITVAQTNHTKGDTMGRHYVTPIITLLVLAVLKNTSNLLLLSNSVFHWPFATFHTLHESVKALKASALFVLQTQHPLSGFVP